jgi:hypothetical protein
LLNAIWIVDAHRDEGRRFAVHADEKLTAFLELEGLVRNARAQSKAKHTMGQLREIRSPCVFSIY